MTLETTNKSGKGHLAKKKKRSLIFKREMEKWMGVKWKERMGEKLDRMIKLKNKRNEKNIYCEMQKFNSLIYITIYKLYSTVTWLLIKNHIWVLMFT